MDTALNTPAPDAINLLLTRRSGSAKSMQEPGPNPDQLQLILRAACRVPDHGKLSPWRFILFEGDARRRAGELFAGLVNGNDAAAVEERKAIERGRFLRAPVVVGVVSRVREAIPIPEWEQILSAGAVCQNMLIAAHALGFVANWITEWMAYNHRVKEALGLKVDERIAGFVYIGTAARPLEERVRPDLGSLITRF